MTITTSPIRPRGNVARTTTTDHRVARTLPSRRRRLDPRLRPQRVDQGVVAAIQRGDPRPDPCHRGPAVVDPGHVRQDRSRHEPALHRRRHVHLLDVAHHGARDHRRRPDVHVRGPARHHRQRRRRTTRPLGHRRRQDDRRRRLRSGDGDSRHDRRPQRRRPRRARQGRHIGHGVDRTRGGCCSPRSHPCSVSASA